MGSCEGGCGILPSIRTLGGSWFSLHGIPLACPIQGGALTRLEEHGTAAKSRIRKKVVWIWVSHRAGGKEGGRDSGSTYPRIAPIQDRLVVDF
jgi:hypothetical protein